MHRSRAAGGAIAVLVLGTLASVLVPLPALAPRVAAQPASPASTTFLIACDRGATVAPTSFALSCGDGASGLDALRWSGWGADPATATGVFRTAACSPNCATGGIDEFAVDVVASARGTNGPVSAYRTLRLSFRGAAPRWAAGATALYDLTGREAGPTEPGSPESGSPKRGAR
jgi:hypothetical protein